MPPDTSMRRPLIQPLTRPRAVCDATSLFISWLSRATPPRNPSMAPGAKALLLVAVVAASAMLRAVQTWRFVASGSKSVWREDRACQGLDSAGELDALVDTHV